MVVHQALRIHPSSIGKKMGQCTFQSKLAVSLLEVLTRKLVGGQRAVQVVGKRTQRPRQAVSLSIELTRNMAQVFVGLQSIAIYRCLSWRPGVGRKFAICGTKFQRFKLFGGSRTQFVSVTWSSGAWSEFGVTGKTRFHPNLCLHFSWTNLRSSLYIFGWGVKMIAKK